MARHDENSFGRSKETNRSHLRQISRFNDGENRPLREDDAA